MPRTFLTSVLMLLAVLPLAACNGGEGEGPGGVTESEARALNEAAEMLDSRANAPAPPTTGEVAQ